MATTTSTPQMTADWNSYFAGSQPGQTRQWGGGTLTRNADGTATFSYNGQNTVLRRDMPFAQVAALSPQIADDWYKSYGFTAPSNVTNQTVAAGNIPKMNALMPFSSQGTGSTANSPFGMGDGVYAPPMQAQQFWQSGAYDPSKQQTAGQGVGTYVQPSQAGGMVNQGQFGTGGNAIAGGGSTAGTTGGTATGGASGGLFQGVDVNSYNQNPYLAQMGTVLTNRVTDNLNRNIMPGIRSNAVMAGGFGGSRQGVVEANAMKDANQTISDALTGAYFQDFTNQMNRNLQQYGQNQGFYSNQRGQDLQQIGLGASLFNQGNQGFLGQGQGIYGLGTTQQQAPWNVVNNGNAGFGQWSGFGTTTQAGGGAQGMLGGALAGGQLGSLWGGPQTNSAGTAFRTGSGTMSDLTNLGVFSR